MKKLTYDERRALQVRYHAAMQVLRDNGAMETGDRLDLLGMVVAPIDSYGRPDPLLGLEMAYRSASKDEEVSDMLSRLTPRQTQVLELSRYMNQHEVAKHLGVSRQNVYQMMRSIREKLGVARSRDAVAILEAA